MKVLVAYQPGELRIIEIDTPKPGPRDILVKVAHCGICATDISIADGTLTLGDGMEPIYPVRIGHEWSGTVVETGTDTWLFKKGDRVISDTACFCGECPQCLKGQYQSCENARPIGTIGNCYPGAFADYMLIPERIAIKIPENVSLQEAALVEPASIGFYGLLKANVGPEDCLLVVGTGPIALGGMACAKGIGLGKVILAGRKQSKLEIGKKMGADVLVNTTEEDLAQAIMRETNGKGVDVILDTTGAPELFNDLLLMMKPSGIIVIPGFYEQELQNVKIDRIIARKLYLDWCGCNDKCGKKSLKYAWQ